jgi:hypothetical protein
MDKKETNAQEEKFDPYFYIASYISITASLFIPYLFLSLDILAYGLSIFKRIYDIVSLSFLLGFNLYIFIVLKKLKSKLKNKEVNIEDANILFFVSIFNAMCLDLPFFFILLYTAFKYYIYLHNMTAYLIFDSLFMLLFGIFMLDTEIDIDEFKKAKDLEINKKQDG